MNKKIISALLAVMLLLGGCARSDSDKYDQTIDSIQSKNQMSDNFSYSQNKSKTLSGTLTISTYFDGSIGKYAQKFMKLYPNVKIQAHLPESGANEFETLEKYGTRIAIELMSGKSADLVDLSHFSTFRYAKSGLLCDLYSFMDNDPSFNKTDYYINIFEAKEYNNALYTMPFYFTYDMMYISRPLSEKTNAHYQTLDYEKMISLYKTIAEQIETTEVPRFMPGVVKESFSEYELPAFFNTHTGKALFDSTAFVQYLNVTNELKTLYDPVSQNWDMTRIAGDDEFMKSDYLFCKLDMTAMDAFNFLIDYKNILPPVPLLSSKGDAGFISSSAEYAIPVNSPNKDLAWEFLKFCIEEKNPPDGTDYKESVNYVLQYNAWVPINIANFYHTFRLQCELDINNFGNSMQWKSGNREEHIEKMLEQIHRWNLQRNRPVSETELWFLVNSDLENFYYYDLATAEETASIIQSKVTAYLNE